MLGPAQPGLPGSLGGAAKGGSPRGSSIRSSSRRPPLPLPPCRVIYDSSEAITGEDPEKRVRQWWRAGEHQGPALAPLAPLLLPPQQHPPAAAAPAAAPVSAARPECQIASVSCTAGFGRPFTLKGVARTWSRSKESRKHEELVELVVLNERLGGRVPAWEARQRLEYLRGFSSNWQAIYDLISSSDAAATLEQVEEANRRVSEGDLGRWMSGSIDTDTGEGAVGAAPPVLPLGVGAQANVLALGRVREGVCERACALHACAQRTRWDTISA